MFEWLGWAATAVFTTSYFCKPSALKRVQMLGAVLWIAYGVATRARPIVGANLLLLAAAVATTWRRRDDAAPAASTSESAANPLTVDRPTHHVIAPTQNVVRRDRMINS
jgi:hypothetical protein